MGMHIYIPLKDRKNAKHYTLKKSNLQQVTIENYKMVLI